MSKVKIQSEYPDLDKYELDNGNIVYYKKDTIIFHNLYGPAYIDKNGKTQFYIDGVLLGVKKLESEYPDLDKYSSTYGNTIYYKKNTNIRHNPYGPALINSNGTFAYYINDVLFGRKKEDFYNNIKNLNTKTINKQNKIDVLNIKNCVTNGLDNDSMNILKLLL